MNIFKRLKNLWILSEYEVSRNESMRDLINLFKKKQEAKIIMPSLLEEFDKNNV